MYLGARRSGGEEENDTDLLKPKKELEQFHDYGMQMSHQVNIVTSFNPDIIEEELVNYLKGMQIEAKVSASKYKIKFDYSAPDTNFKDRNYELQICVRILKVDEEKVCVEFNKTKGPQDKYRQIVDDLKKSKSLTSIVA
jgi:hypothetical protein